MLKISSKLIDFKSNECVGVICRNGVTSVPLSIDKAKELDVQDIDIIQYLNTDINEVAVNPRRKNYVAFLSNSIGFLDNFDELNYEKMGDTLNKLDTKEVIWGYVFKFIDFIELDNEIAIRKALSNEESLND